MSYNPVSSLFMRRSKTTTTHGASSTVSLDLGDNIIGATQLNSGAITANSNSIYCCCDVVYTAIAGGTTAIQFQSEFAGSVGDDDTGRQTNTHSTSTVIARDEFWARGTSLTPKAIGLSLTNCEVLPKDAVVGGVIHS